MCGRCCAWPEAEQIQAIHRNEGLVCGSGRQGESGVGKHCLLLDLVLSALHRENDVWFRRDDGFVVHRLLTFERIDGVDTAREADDRIRRGLLTRDHGAAVEE